ncbi:MAG: hypothetical protein V9E88_15245 [Ferruginibacter sp.]
MMFLKTVWPLTATATSGMVGLGTSAPFSFNVVAYTGPSTFIWSNPGASAWLTGSNWQTGTAPGASIPGNQHLASFTIAGRIIYCCNRWMWYQYEQCGWRLQCWNHIF